MTKPPGQTANEPMIVVMVYAHHSFDVSSTCTLNQQSATKTHLHPSLIAGLWLTAGPRGVAKPGAAERSESYAADLAHALGVWGYHCPVVVAPSSGIAATTNALTLGYNQRSGR